MSVKHRQTLLEPFEQYRQVARIIILFVAIKTDVIVERAFTQQIRNLSQALKISHGITADLDFQIAYALLGNIFLQRLRQTIVQAIIVRNISGANRVDQANRVANMQ